MMHGFFGRLFLFIFLAPFAASQLSQAAESPEGPKTSAKNHCDPLLAGFVRLAEVFPRMSDLDAIVTLNRAYPELSILASQVSPSIDPSNSPPRGSPSVHLFGSHHPEYDRSALTLLILKWILANDYGRLTSGQPKDVQLSRSSFETLRNYTLRILQTPQDIDAMVTYIVTYDLGHVESVISRISHSMSVAGMDSEELLFNALSHHSELAPSFARMPPQIRKSILDALNSDFSFGQFLQGENVPASLRGIFTLERKSRHFFLLKSIFDFAADKGDAYPVGARMLTEPNFIKIRTALEILETAQASSPLQSAYDHYLYSQALQWNMDFGQPLHKAAVRLALMLKLTKTEEAMEVLLALQRLNPDQRSLLLYELNFSGLEHEGWAIMLYYSSAFLENLYERFLQEEHPHPLAETFNLALPILANLYRDSRAALGPRSGHGVFKVNILPVANQVKSPELFTEKSIQVRVQGENAEAIVFDESP